MQDLAIARWDDAVVGWKVGYIAPERRDASGDERLLGPVFARHLWNATGGIVDIPVFSGAGGFAAVEAEYVLELQVDAPADKIDWTPDEAAALPARLFIGVEVASSPLATINVLGPRVVVSDFGNNNGLVLGTEIVDWARLDEAGLLARYRNRWASGWPRRCQQPARRLARGLCVRAVTLGQTRAAVEEGRADCHRQRHRHPRHCRRPTGRGSRQPW